MDHRRARTNGTSWSGAAQRRLGRWSAACVVVVGFAWWVVSLPPFSGLATGAVLLSGLAASLAGRAGRRRTRAAVNARRAGAWAALAAGAVAWEVLAYMQHPRPDHPTLSSLTNVLLDSHAARAAAFVVWLMAMLELARR